MNLPAHKPIEVEAWLSRLGQPSADRDYKPGHQRMQELLQPLAIKRPKLRIRIAGTNGKGSTAFMLSNALQACGLRVGLYTSPHIRRFNERIRINATPVSDTTLNVLMQSVMPSALKTGASYFEAATALALKHFSDQGVEVEILEAGVGARLDATTAVAADMALLTPIGLDHQAWLGDTLESVASEKAHVFKDCHFNISASQSERVLTILRNHCPTLEITPPTDAISPVAFGDHQKQNASLAWRAVQILLEEGLIDRDKIAAAKAAIESTSVPGRLQKVVHGDATIWLDAAHNAHAVEALLPTLPLLAEPLTSILIFTREDRDLSGSHDLLRPFTRRLTGEQGQRLDACYASVADALKEELALHPDGTFLILGSFITVAAALDWLERNY